MSILGKLILLVFWGGAFICLGWAVRFNIPVLCVVASVAPIIPLGPIWLAPDIMLKD
jgi:hypothetical protein